MKCPEWEPDPTEDGGCKWGCYDEICPHPEAGCSSAEGWIPFWTPSERAGLKAMGKHWKYLKRISEIRAASVRANIRAYVEASRRVKEGKCDE
jgi:hypothetical protein